MRYALRPTSLRVPWHDTAWDGRVCANPHLNSSCLKLRRIAQGRNDAAEDETKGQLLSDLPEKQWPCCLGERVSFLAPFELRSASKINRLPKSGTDWSLVIARKDPTKCPTITLVLIEDFR